MRWYYFPFLGSSAHGYIRLSSAKIVNKHLHLLSFMALASVLLLGTVSMAPVAFADNNDGDQPPLTTDEKKQKHALKKAERAQKHADNAQRIADKAQEKADNVSPEKQEKAQNKVSD